MAKTSSSSSKKRARSGERGARGGKVSKKGSSSIDKKKKKGGRSKKSGGKSGKTKTAGAISPPRCKVLLKMGSGGKRGKTANGGKKGKKSGKKKSGRGGKRSKSAAAVSKTSTGRPLAVAARRYPPGVMRKPTAMQGRIYYGSGLWGGGGDGGDDRQVGGAEARENSFTRTSCKPSNSLCVPPGPRVASAWPHPSFVSYGNTAMYGGGSDMHGAGVGAVFSGILKTLVPVFKGIFRVGSAVAKSPVGQAIKTEVIKSGLNTGINVVGDALRGRNLANSAKNRVSQQARKLPSNIERAISKIPNNNNNNNNNKNKPSSSSSSASTRATTTTARKREKKKMEKPQPIVPTLTSGPPNAATSRGKRKLPTSLRNAGSRMAKLVKWSPVNATRRKDLFHKQ